MSVEHVVEDRKLRALAGRDMQAGLGHDRQQADRLEATVLPPVFGPVTTRI